MYPWGPLVALALAAGCGRVGFSEVTGDGSTTPLDAQDVAATDAPASCVDWSARHFVPCALPSPMGGLLIGSGTWTYDTSTGVLTDPGGGASSPPSLVVASGRVLSVDTFGVVQAGTLRVVGDRPLIIASWDTMDIEGTIDASSSLTSLGAGANPASCSTHAPENGRDDSSGASGAGGGALQGPGGKGGTGSSGAGGLGGGAVPMPLLEGGCPGGVGGRGGPVPSVGVRGAGAGAIQLTARTWIALDGTILAGGAGGGGGNAQSGGGGGGSGGMIGLEAPMVTIGPTSVVAANGGSGGGGSDSGARGGDGVTGLPSAQRAAGGLGADSTSNNDGGDGSGGPVLMGGDGVTGDPNAGGGAGGGAGYICIASPSVSTTTAVISPAYVTP